MSPIPLFAVILAAQTPVEAPMLPPNPIISVEICKSVSTRSDMVTAISGPSTRVDDIDSVLQSRRAAASAKLEN